MLNGDRGQGRPVSPAGVEESGGNKVAPGKSIISDLLSQGPRPVLCFCLLAGEAVGAEEVTLLLTVFHPATVVEQT